MRISKVHVRVLCLALCLAVLLPCASALGETTKVAAYLLRLREGPSTNAKVLDAYPRGTLVTILRKGDSWTRVRVHGKVGYMQTNLLSYGRYGGGSGSSGSGSGGGGSVTSGSTAYIMKGYRVNLRAEPDSGSEIITSFRGGTRVTVIKKGKFWSHVEVKGLDGYMWNDYLTTDND